MTSASRPWYALKHAGVAELADALDLGSSALWRGGSSPLVRTNKYIIEIKASGFPEAFFEIGRDEIFFVVISQEER